jgi:hypothetical protein
MHYGKGSFNPILSSLFALFLIGACTFTKPIYEVQKQPLPAAASTLSLSEIEARIIRAGKVKNWEMKSEKPGIILGTYRRKRHSAVVRIHYNAATFSILYVTSHRMLAGVDGEDSFNEGERVIHRRYNNYVIRLRREIEAQLSGAGA